MDIRCVLSCTKEAMELAMAPAEALDSLVQILTCWSALARQELLNGLEEAYIFKHLKLELTKDILQLHASCVYSLWPQGLWTNANACADRKFGPTSVWPWEAEPRQSQLVTVVSVVTRIVSYCLIALHSHCVYSMVTITQSSMWDLACLGLRSMQPLSQQQQQLLQQLNQKTNQQHLQSLGTNWWVLGIRYNRR